MHTDVFVCEEGSVDQGFGLMINTLPFIDSNDKIKSIYHDESAKSKFCHSLMYPDCFIATQFRNPRTPRTPIKWCVHTILFRSRCSACQ